MAVININFEKIQLAIEYIMNAETPNKQDIISSLIQSGFTQEEAENWINQFVQVMCNFLGFEVDMNNCFNWVKNQAKLGKTSDIITEQLIGMFGTLLSTTNVVIIYRNGVLYKEFAPLNIAKIEFNKVLITFEENKRVARFQYRDTEYKLDFENSPLKLKQLYIAKLVLNGNNIPEDLKQYYSSAINIDDLNIEFDLTKCIEV